jgi:hypothetical protein
MLQPHTAEFIRARRAVVIRFIGYTATGLRNDAQKGVSANQTNWMLLTARADQAN